MPFAQAVNLKVVCPSCGRDVWVVASVGGCKAVTGPTAKHTINIKDVIPTVARKEAAGVS